MIANGHHGTPRIPGFPGSSAARPCWSLSAAPKQAVDWSLAWNRQITVQGTINFGPGPALAGRHTMAQVVEWLADPRYRVDGIVTHVFDLADWAQALQAASAGPRAGCIKATLRPNPDLPLVGE